jgi:putative chitinase
MVDFDEADILKLCHGARPDYVSALVASKELLDKLDIIDTSKRFCAWIAQIAHESGGLKISEENLNYSAKRLMQVWPKRFPTLAKAQQYAHNPEKLANYTYSDEFRDDAHDLGNVEPGDGWRFRGRGLMQITGRSEYTRIGKRIGLDLVGKPDLASDPYTAVVIAAHLFAERGCCELADKGKFKAITKKINGGYIGLEDRIRYHIAAQQIFKDAPVKNAPAPPPPVQPPTSMAQSTEGNVAIMIGGVSGQQAGQEVANAVAKSNADGVFTMAELVSNIAASPWFWTTVIMSAGAIYIWLRRRARLVTWGV